MTALRTPLPAWAAELAALYESGAVSQFILHGNLQDRFPISSAGTTRLASLGEFLLSELLPGFDVVISYDLGNGIRVEKGGEIVAQWPAFNERADLPKEPRVAIEWLTHFLRYTGNLARLGHRRHHVACILKAADLIAPVSAGGGSYELGAIALLIREWSTNALIAEHSIATFLLTENLGDLHSSLVANPRAAKIRIPLPGPTEISSALTALAPRYPCAVAEFHGRLPELAAVLAGTSLNGIESLLKLKEYRREALKPSDLVALKKQLVEAECQGLIEFVEPRRTLDDLYGLDPVKAWLRQDLALWDKGDLRGVPMGYLICGPVGTGKTYLVECLAGEAGIPVVKIRNFRDKWVGSTEGNLEKIFRLLASLNRCYVFIDEADQALGRRDSSGNDSGLSGRIYSMIAAEMSRPENRGRVIWVLATSRPDLVEVDLKRPGRVDVKIPLFPTETPEQSWALLAGIAKRFQLDLNVVNPAKFRHLIPRLLTPGAAEALALRIYRESHTRSEPLEIIVEDILRAYAPAVALEVMEKQIRLAVDESSDLTFVPERFRGTAAFRSE